MKSRDALLFFVDQLASTKIAYDRDRFVTLLNDAIATARADENEECAKVAEEWIDGLVPHHYVDRVSSRIARVIRARTAKPPHIAGCLGMVEGVACRCEEIKAMRERERAEKGRAAEAEAIVEALAKLPASNGMRPKTVQLNALIERARRWMGK